MRLSAAWKYAILMAALLGGLLTLRHFYQYSGREEVQDELIRAHSAEQQLKLREAEGRYQHALESDPNDPETLRGLALLYCNSDRPSMALPLVRRLKSFTPTSWPLPLLLGFDVISPDGYSEARTAVLDSIARHPECPGLFLDLAELILNGCATNSGNNWSEGPTPQRAREALDRAAEAKADEGTLHVLLGELRLLEGNLDAARQEMESALRLGIYHDPRLHLQAALDAGFIAVHTSDQGAARRHLQEATNVFDAWRDFHILRAKPAREFVMMTRHVYFGEPVDLGLFDRYQEEYRLLDANGVAVMPGLEKSRSSIPRLYRLLEKGDLQGAGALAQGFEDHLGRVGGCSTWGLLSNHMRTVVWLEMGDLAGRVGHPADAANFYRKAQQLFPRDPWIARRLNQPVGADDQDGFANQRAGSEGQEATR